MRTDAYASLTVFLLVIACPASAQTTAPTAESTADGGIPMSRLVASVSKKTGKKFLVDPRVRADINLVGEDVSNVDYSEFLTILGVYGFAAVESGGYVRIVPDAGVRQLALPLVSGKEKHADLEFVTAVIPVRNMPAADLIPLLRPLLPQVGHLAAVRCSNTMIMVDTYGNVKRIEALVQAVDTGAPYKVESCADSEPAPVSKDQASNR